MAFSPTIRTLSPSAIARINRAVHWYERQGARNHPPYGDPRRLGESMPIYNNSGGAIDAGGAVQLSGGLNADGASYNVIKIATLQIQDVVLATADIATADWGRAWLLTGGIYGVLADNYAAVAVGDRLNTIIANFDLVIDYMGPFLVGEKVADPVVLARFQPIGVPPLLKTTAAAGGGTITAKQVDEAFGVVGDNRTFLTQ